MQGGYLMMCYATPQMAILDKAQISKTVGGWRLTWFSLIFMFFSASLFGFDCGSYDIPKRDPKDMSEMLQIFPPKHPTFYFREHLSSTAWELEHLGKSTHRESMKGRCVYNLRFKLGSWIAHPSSCLVRYVRLCPSERSRKVCKELCCNYYVIVW